MQNFPLANALLSLDRKNALIHTLENEAYGNIKIACRKAGIERKTYYRWRYADLEFQIKAKVAIMRGKSLLRDLAEEALVKRIAEGDTKAIIFALKSLDKKQYGKATYPHYSQHTP